jgi:hypothetical protein
MISNHEVKKLPAKLKKSKYDPTTLSIDLLPTIVQVIENSEERRNMFC